MFLSCLQNVHYTISFQSESDISVGKQNEMEARQFEQHQNTIGHKNQGRKPGQTALPDLRNIPQVELTDIAIAMRLSTAWWLAKEDVAIHKFSSLVINKLISHRYDCH